MFLEQRTIRQVAGDVLGRHFRCCFARDSCAALLAWVLYLFTDRDEANGWIEGFWLMVMLIGWSAALRAFRPYINEIILLEKSAVGQSGAAITVGKRSAHRTGRIRAICSSAGAEPLAVSLLWLASPCIRRSWPRGF